MKVADNVRDFINRASEAVGRFKADDFNQSTYGALGDDGGTHIDSPIEQILYTAMIATAKITSTGMADDPFKSDDGEWHVLGLHVSPQYQVGKYRADFRVTYEYHSSGGLPLTAIGPRPYAINAVLVECDSQQFHERSERERRYEKQRDRYFASQGFKVFHFTGSEIVSNPWRVAAEILAEVLTYDRRQESVEDLLAEVEDYLGD